MIPFWLDEAQEVLAGSETNADLNDCRFDISVIDVSEGDRVGDLDRTIIFGVIKVRSFNRTRDRSLVDGEFIGTNVRRTVTGNTTLVDGPGRSRGRVVGDASCVKCVDKGVVEQCECIESRIDASDVVCAVVSSRDGDTAIVFNNVEAATKDGSNNVFATGRG